MIDVGLYFWDELTKEKDDCITGVFVVEGYNTNSDIDERDMCVSMMKYLCIVGREWWVWLWWGDSKGARFDGNDNVGENVRRGASLSCTILNTDKDKATCRCDL